MKKTCKHFRGEIPGYEADELRVQDTKPCEVCDVKPRVIRVGDETFHIPQFNASVNVHVTWR